MSFCHVCVCIMAPLRPLHHLLDVNIAPLCQRCHSRILPFNFAYVPAPRISGYMPLVIFKWSQAIIQCNLIPWARSNALDFVTFLIALFLKSNTFFSAMLWQILVQTRIELMANIRSIVITTTYGGATTFSSTLQRRCDSSILLWVWISTLPCVRLGGWVLLLLLLGGKEEKSIFNYERAW